MLFGIGGRDANGRQMGGGSVPPDATFGTTGTAISRAIGCANVINELFDVERIARGWNCVV
jgi:hypothetical protein